jgi:hypothetical protein
MSSLNDLTRRLELRDAEGSTVGVVLPVDQLKALEEECQRLRQQLATQQQRNAELLGENQLLREEKERIARERDAFYRWHTEQLREEARKYPERVEAEILEGMRTGADFVAFVRGLGVDLPIGSFSSGTSD